MTTLQLSASCVVLVPRLPSACPAFPPACPAFPPACPAFPPACLRCRRFCPSHSDSVHGGKTNSDAAIASTTERGRSKNGQTAQSKEQSGRKNNRRGESNAG
ncbi:hypothetical protein E6P09_07325 [Haloferax mediterranei ATCC 33500]|uniref:Uncharacterized protein n=1 Tax=Haloferax mediterranei (strain ATCC 33500 / DSM 1411 / JCM 8866 / NBRC 14739 / NCIMB 2177 / R-4) TaxID=523841 RepID=A0A4P8P478_HALMT|nr:hypothetical protein E6P09_07325 [Haloferax mediterranei ATCC 33500]